MKFIGKLLLTLLLLVVLAVALLYVIGQTRWAAGWVSRWVSDNSDYRLSVAAISHSWNQPGQISLEDVQLAKKSTASAGGQTAGPRSQPAPNYRTSSFP